MPIRDLLVVSLIFGSLPVCVARPWIGVLIYTWMSLMNPHRYAWTFAVNFPVAMLPAVATLVGLALTRDRGPFPRGPHVTLLALLWGYFCFTTLFAINQYGAWDQLEKVSKVLFMVFVTLALINTPSKLRYYVLSLTLPIALIGLKGGLFALTSGGQYRVQGPGGSFIAGNNEIGMALNMILPLLLYLARDEPRWWFRCALRLLFAASAVAILFTYSRGAVITLCVMGAAFLLRAQRRVLAAALLSLAITVGALVVPDKWTDRMETIEHYDTDGSFQGRVNAWGMAWNLALDRPLTGGGFETFIWPVFAVYGPDPNNVHDVHSIYFEILGEHGFVAFGLWAGLILLTLLTLRGLMRQARRDPALAWTRHYPIMLETGILAYLVAGLALGQAYFDLFWNMVAMSIILRSLVDREARGRTTTPSLDSHAALEARVLVPARHAPGMRRR